MKRTLFAGLATLALAGCAQQDAASADSTRGWVERQFRTGSHIPSKRGPEADGVQTMTKEELDKIRDSSLNPGVSIPPPRPGSR